MTLDPRLHAFRRDLANEHLRGKVDSQKFVEGKQAFVRIPVADLRAGPAFSSAVQTQALYGHKFFVFERRDGWAWVQAAHDGYVGYVPSDTLDMGHYQPTHMVRAQRTFLYPEPDLKSPQTGALSIGSMVKVLEETENRGTEYGALENGQHIVSNHLIRIGEWLPDPVSVAETLLHTPYLWAGTSGFGVDCSGLVQTSNMLCGRMVLRDSDMQEATIGEQIEPDFSALQRGDLVFWKGHVGIMRDSETLLHANGNTMDVALEPLAQAIDRIGYLYGQPTSVRRLQ